MRSNMFKQEQESKDQLSQQEKKLEKQLQDLKDHYDKEVIPQMQQQADQRLQEGLIRLSD